MRSALLFPLLLTGCVLTTLMTQGRSLPDTSGQAPAKGLGSPVTVHRDERGVPHIRAAGEADAAYALGYVHAQDRLFQLDAGRRLVFGELSELVGPEAAALDAFMQGLGLRARAEESLRALDPDTKVALAAYAEGVNAGARSLKGMPVEHRLVGMDRWREDWTPVDSMATLQLLSWTLSDGWREELFALLYRDALDRADLDALFRVEPQSPEADAWWGRARTARVGGLTPAARAFFDRLADFSAPQASNAWVVSGARTADGKPILANDPHLYKSVPAPFYLADVAGGGRHAAGLTLPGLPFVVIGHNGQVAWGLTSLCGDTVDIALLRRDGEDGYLLAGERRAFERRPVRVEVREEAAREGEALVTAVGPVLTELGDSNHVAALRWVALEHPDRSADALRAIAAATRVEEAQAAARLPTGTALNLVIADTAGDIGWQVSGTLPQRVGFTGRLPHPASEVGIGWTGTVAVLPAERNPKRGVIVSANHRPAPEGKTPYDANTLGAIFPPPYRAQRIGELLDATPRHDLRTTATIQADLLDMQARARVPALLEGLSPNTPGATWVLEQLRAWNYQADANSNGPLVWAELQRQLVRLALLDRIGEDGVRAYLSATLPGQSLVDTPTGLTRFFEDPSASLRKAMLATYDALQVGYGPDPGAWTWGLAHPLRLMHPYSAATGKLSAFNAGEWEWDGSDNTVSVGGTRWAHGWEATHIAAMRLIVPLSNPRAAEVVLPPGQSGQPASRHYQDQVRAWANGERYPLWFDDADVAQHAALTMELVPE